MVVEIKLSKRSKTIAGLYVAIVDDIDADLDNVNWNAEVHSPKRQYAVGSQHERMHRVIMERMLGGEIPDGMEVDHINGDSLCNTRDNLRLATRAQNSANIGRRKGRHTRKAPYKGVGYNGKKYTAQIRRNGETFNLGRFDTAEEAHAAYCKKAVELFGEFANFGEETPFVQNAPSAIQTIANIRAEIVEKAKARNAELYAVEQAKVEKRNAALLRQIEELSEIAATHKNPYISEVARKRLHKLTIQAIRYGLRFALENESAA